MLKLHAGKISARNACDVQLSRDHGISGEYCETGREALARLGLYDYDLLLIDLDLPDMPGQEVIRLARAAGHATPCIILAAAAARQIMVTALDHGADDFVSVPCDPEELLARMRAVVRRSQLNVVPDPRLGCVEISLGRHEFRVNGALLPVSRREFALLEFLFRKPGQEVSKNALLRHIYIDGEVPDLKTIDVFVCRLRKRLGEAGVFGLIETAWGRGFVLREPRFTVEPTNVVPFVSARMAA